MSLQDYWQGVQHRVAQYTFQDFPPEGAEAAEAYAKNAYACCVAWFGPPLDPHKPYVIQQAVAGSAFCVQWRGKYYLAISKEAVSPEQLCSEIAHEMYHRVTAGRKGLANEMWVQEMMAILSSHWFLRRRGFMEYADAVENQWLEAPGKANVALLRASHRRRGGDYILRGGEIYTAEFTNSAGRIGHALIRIIDGDDLCRIAKATALEEWIASLPEEKQYSVCRVLEIPPASRGVPKDKVGLAKLYKALGDKGDRDAVIAQFQQIVHLQPENGNAFYYLGGAYKGAQQYDTALDAYQKALSFNFQDRWLQFSIGSAYWQKRDFSSAAHWYLEATHCDPGWGMAYYFLGRSLNNLGDVNGARQAWEHTITLADEHYAEWARKALQENPPLETADGGERLSEHDMEGEVGADAAAVEARRDAEVYKGREGCA